MSKESIYQFLKRTYPKHLILFSKDNRVYKYSKDYDIYNNYPNISYLIVDNNILIKREFKDNKYDEGIIKYKITNVLKKVMV